MKRHWEQGILKKPNIFHKDVDYESLQAKPIEISKFAAFNGHQFDILTYEQLEDIPHLFSKQVLAKYTTIVCDDSELWLDPSVSVNLSSDIRRHMKSFFEGVGPQQQLLVLTSSLSLNITEVIETESIL